MKNTHLDCTLILSTDGSVYIEAKRLQYRMEARIPPARALAIREAVEHAEWEHDPKLLNFASVAYSEETGKLALVTGGGVEYFDPLNDESLAKFVRRLKARAPAPKHVEAPPLPGILPEPTEEQLARRTIYSAVGSAEGVTYRKPSKHRQAPAASAERSKELIANALGLLKARNV